MISVVVEIISNIPILFACYSQTYFKSLQQHAHLFRVMFVALFYYMTSRTEFYILHSKRIINFFFNKHLTRLIAFQANYELLIIE